MTSSSENEEKKSKFQVQTEALLAEWTEDAKFGPEVSQEIQNVPILHNKYYTKLLRVRVRLKELTNRYEEVEFERTLFYTGRASAEVYKNERTDFNISKGELPLFMKADKQLKQLRYQLDCLKEIEKMLNEIIAQINDRKWTLRTLLDAEKFKAGVN